jgi:hypothetical protein
MNKRDELELYVIEEKPDIIGITETWANTSIGDAELNLDGYRMLRKDRITGKKIRGGGVLLYIKNCYDIIEREDFNDQNFPESIWCDLKIGGEKTLIGICYRPPNSNIVEDEALFNFFCKASKEKVLIMGDFNFSGIDWNRSVLDESNLFAKCVSDSFLFQCVNCSTRGENILDLVFVSEENMVENLTVGELFDSSDHNIIRWNFVAGKERNLKVDRRKFLNYFKADYVRIREEAALIDWSKIVEGNDSNLDSIRFKNVLIDIRDRLVPIRKQHANKCKWVNKSVTKCRRAKYNAWVEYRDDKTEVNSKNYKNKLKISQGVIKRAKRNFEKKLADNIKNDCKSFYSYVRSKQRTKDKVGPLKDSLNNIITDDELTANLFNDYFSTVFTQEDCSCIPEPVNIFDYSLGQGLLEIDITRDMVYKKLEKLKVNKCPGLDEIHPKLLFELRNIISEPLTKLYNASLRSGVVPDDWKDAGVTPLFKKGNKSDVQNYRPVSLTSITCKIMESIIKDAVLEHLDEFLLIKQSQHGFTKGRSCLTNLLEFLEDVTKSLDDSNPVDIVYLDFAKAFDKVPFQRLFKKLYSHGVGGKILGWIQNWLTGRKQKVGINKIYSRWQNVVSGVPQGSVLGPLLFVIYINDLDCNIVSKLCKFADDTKLGRSVKNVVEVDKLREDLNRIYQWSVDWQMLFNVDKCTVMHMGRTNLKNDYSLGGNVLKKIEQEKDLGVMINFNGKQSEQCLIAAKKANTVLGMIKRNISFKSKENMVRLYKALVRPRLEYCIQAWCPYLRKDIELLESVQRRATKQIEGYWNLRYEDRLKRTKLISLEKRRVRGDLIQVFKILKGFDKVDYRDYFEISQENRTRGHSLKLVKKRSKSDIRKYFFTQRIIEGWNKLPQYVVDADSINCFKNRLDEFDVYWKGESK